MEKCCQTIVQTQDSTSLDAYCSSLPLKEMKIQLDDSTNEGLQPILNLKNVRGSPIVLMSETSPLTLMNEDGKCYQVCLQNGKSGTTPVLFALPCAAHASSSVQMDPQPSDWILSCPSSFHKSAAVGIQKPAGLKPTSVESIASLISDEIKTQMRKQNVHGISAERLSWLSHLTSVSSVTGSDPRKRKRFNKDESDAGSFESTKKQKIGFEMEKKDLSIESPVQLPPLPEGVRCHANVQPPTTALQIARKYVDRKRTVTGCSSERSKIKLRILRILEGKAPMTCPEELYTLQRAFGQNVKGPKFKIVPPLKEDMEEWGWDPIKQCFPDVF